MILLKAFMLMAQQDTNSVSNLDVFFAQLTHQKRNKPIKCI